jgi:hypothetical protein
LRAEAKLEDVIQSARLAKWSDESIDALRATDISRVFTKQELNNMRRTAVRQAWAAERRLVMPPGGLGTREWTAAEITELRATGRVKGYVGHHMFNVANYPWFARNPENIEFLSYSEHYSQHLSISGRPWGGPTRPSTGVLMNRGSGVGAGGGIGSFAGSGRFGIGSIYIGARR